MRMSIAAYQTLYESSVAFGMRKALQAEQGKSDMEAKVGAPCALLCSPGLAAGADPRPVHKHTHLKLHINIE